VIESTICSLDGWAGISFHKSGGIDTSSFIAVSWFSSTGNVLKMSEIQSHQNKLLKETSIGYSISKEKQFFHSEFVGKQRFKMIILQSNLIGFDYISIVCLNTLPSENMTFSKHDRVTTRYFDFLNSKSICDSFVRFEFIILVF
jgi:hypothetical protein